MGSDSAFGEPNFSDPADEIATLREKLAASDAARREAESEIDHWRVKARCYGDIVHGCSPALAASGFPVDATQIDGAVGGIARSVASLASALASERVSRESWEREANTANAERIRLHNEAENFSERIGQFEAAGFPNVATVLDRIVAERGVREKAERELRLANERAGWSRVWAIVETLGISGGGCPDHLVVSHVERLRSDLTAAESSLSRAVEALREIGRTAKVDGRAICCVHFLPVGDCPTECNGGIARAALAEIGGKR